MSPSSPLRAHHRFMQNVLSTHFGDKRADPTPAELDRVSAVFGRAGGSWEGVFQGSTKDFDLLRKTLKVALNKGFITKAPDWGS